MQGFIVESKRHALSAQCLRRKNPRSDSGAETVGTRVIQLRPEGNRNAEAPFLAGGAFPETERTYRGGVEKAAAGRLDDVDAPGVSGGGEGNAIAA